MLLGKILARPCNLLLLDEPTNHLDLESIKAMVKSLQRFSGAMLIVTHNEWILRSLCTSLVYFQNDGPGLFAGDYDTFLEKIGWEDERDQEVPSATREGASEYGEGRRERAADRARLRPLKKEVERIEKAICQAEEKVKLIDQKLVEASSKGESSPLAELARERTALLASIDALFEELETAFDALRSAETIR